MSMPVEYRQIIQTLLFKTNQGVAHWKQETFQLAVTFGDSKFAMWAGSDEHSDEPFVAFALQDASGKTIDSWFVEQVDGEDYTMTRSLYTSANRRALGVPEKLRSLQERLAAADRIGDDESVLPWGKDTGQVKY